MAHALGRLAASAAGHWKRSLAIVAAILVVIGGASALGGGAFVDSFSTPGTESQKAIDLLTQRFPAQSGDTATLVFATGKGTLKDNPAIAQTAATVKRQPHVTGVSPLQLSANQRIGFLTVQYDKPAQDLQRAPGERLADVSSIGEKAGLEVSRRGPIVDQAEQLAAPVGELIGLAVAIIVLTLVFRSIAAMLLTLIASLIALAGGILLLRFGAAFTDFPSFAPTLGVMLGLGAGIDYALLIVGRYREQLAAGDSVAHSARVANSTAGTSVVAAGAIVVVAIAGLLATGIPFVGRMGVGSAIVVASVAVGAVTVLPTLMGAFARRLKPKNPESVAPSRAFGNWATRITKRPKTAAIAGTLVLVALATPVLGLRLGMPDDGNDAKGTTTRIAYDRLAEGFGVGFNGPLVLATDNMDALQQTKAAAEKTPGVAFVSDPVISPKHDAATFTVIPKTSPQDPKTSDLVTNLRDTLPNRVYVGGAVATLDDMAAKIASRLPIFIALVIGLSIVLLMAVFRSIWVPLVSAAFNLLSIGAAYGVVVLVFQTGMDVPIVSFVPLFMFAILFGLSMDYNVFLQSRIREEYLKGATPEESVTRALGRVGRIILAAGAIMTAVFLGFVGDPDVVVKTIGLGLASAILIDVLIVRMIVAPAVMTLLGDRAWALPAWLDRALPKISLEGEPEALPA
ncbi:MMPL family transporter [Solirubrobacter ginsenosidimutans]|uniref:MMPL family transporter n=1 Tax=Solirubrobacter ginsenosidimutans TaxID=490573 RepID=A0A9X3N2R2_9ACTN|nr:MMPL family transporter [Solirubrobacter ginsenosidimutans]MDA0165965.1 MMPL family transporter [Solirubrobacter ginsenosidimutans]